MHALKLPLVHIGSLIISFVVLLDLVSAILLFLHKKLKLKLCITTGTEIPEDLSASIWLVLLSIEA